MSHSKKNLVGYYHKYTQESMESTRYSSQISMKIQFSRQFPKHTEISNFMKISPVGSLVVPCRRTTHTERRTDRQTDMRKLIAAFAVLRKRLLTFSEEVVHKKVTFV